VELRGAEDILPNDRAREEFRGLVRKFGIRQE
jgi:hypothetical protein